MSTNTILFRPMQEKDRSSVSEMMYELYQYLGAEKEYMNEQKISATFQHLALQKGDLSLQVFEKDTVIVGYALLFHFWSNEYGGLVLNVDELYLKPEYRGKGISTQFLTQLIEKKGNYVAMTLEVLPDNEKAHALYKRIGFSERETLFLVKPL